MSGFIADGAFEQSLARLLAPGSGQVLAEREDLPDPLGELRARLDTVCRGPGHSEREAAVLVEAIRMTAEWMALGERKNLPSLESLQSRGLLEAFGATLRAGSCAQEVKVQVLQSLSILVPQLRRQASIVYLLSVLNPCFDAPPDLEDEELMAYFVTIVKGLAIHLDAETVQHCLVPLASEESLEGQEAAVSVGCDAFQLFPMAPRAGCVRQTPKRMPLFDCAVRLVDNRDSMVQTAARAAVLMMLRFEHAAVREAVRPSVQDTLAPSLVRMTKNTQVSSVRWKRSDPAWEAIDEYGAAAGGGGLRMSGWASPIHPAELVIEFIRLHEVEPLVLKLLPAGEDWHFKNMSDACVALEQMLQPRLSDDLLEFIEELFALRIPTVLGALQLQGFSVDPEGRLFLGDGNFTPGASPRARCASREGKALGYRYIGLPDGLVLSVSGFSPSRGTGCCVWQKKSAEPTQKWRLTADGHLECMTGLFLAVAQDSTELGSKICVWDHRAQNGQRWSLEADGHLRNGHGMYLAVSANREGAGQKVIAWRWKHEFGQTWSWQN